jgi:hypothetical protein
MLSGYQSATQDKSYLLRQAPSCPHGWLLRVAAGLHLLHRFLQQAAPTRQQRIWFRALCLWLGVVLAEPKQPALTQVAAAAAAAVAPSKC